MEEQVKNDGKFKKGKSGNAKGRPKEPLCLTTLIKKELQKNNNEAANAIIKKGIEEATRGNHKYFDTMIKYIDGLPKQKIELSGDEQNPLNIIFKVDKPNAD